jgi:hypothetical protein
MPSAATDHRSSRSDAPPDTRRVGPHHHAAGAALVLLMAVGSIVMWLATPVFWLWVASRMTSSTQPSAGPYVLVLAGTIVTMIVIGKALGAANRAHMRITGRDRGGRQQATWLKSMRGERAPTRDRGVLEPVMMASVALALAAMAVWFFAFAGSSLPT